jgi:prepilin-type N-terminal cleavage/methylation domain-containing protein
MSKTRLGGRQNGFTIIELLIVIVVAGIVLALVVANHVSSQQKARNTERRSDISALRLALEGYYSKTNHYPTRKKLNSKSWRDKHIKALGKQTLRDPSSTSYQLAKKPAKHTYAYHPTSAKGKTCDNQKTPCKQYKLTATLEGGGRYTKQNLN